MSAPLSVSVSVQQTKLAVSVEILGITHLKTGRC